MIKRLFYIVSLLIALCNASLFCTRTFSATISGDEVTLLHTITSARGNCPNNTYNIEITKTMYDNNMLYSRASTCPSNYHKVYLYGPYVIGDEENISHTTTFTQGNCPNNTHNLEITQTMYDNNMLFSQASVCPSGYNKVLVKGVTAGDEKILCDNGHLNNGTCSSYVSMGVQEGYYNLGLNSNTFTESTDDTCESGQFDITLPYQTMDICQDTRTKVYINWDGVDVTGTPAEFCYYGDIFNAPTMIPTSPSGYKFIGWTPIEPKE